MDSINTFFICMTIVSVAGIGANLIVKTRRPAKTWMCFGRRVVDGEWHDYEYGPFQRREAADRFRYGWLLNESESAFMVVDEAPDTPALITEVN